MRGRRVRGSSLFSDLEPGGDDLHAEVFGEDFGHRRQGQPFGKATKLLSESTDLLSQLPELLVGLLELPVSLFLSDGEAGDEFFQFIIGHLDSPKRRGRSFHTTNSSKVSSGAQPRSLWILLESMA